MSANANFIQHLQELHLALNAHETQLLGRAISVVEEELLPRLDVPLGEDADAVVAVHLQHFGLAVGIDGVVGEPDLVALPRGVHDELVVEVEEEGAHVLVVHLSSPVRLVLGDDLAAILGDKLVLVGKVFDEDAPAGNVGRGHEQFLAKAPLDL